jgi:chemotaxis protein methyltransferase CheR
MNLEPTVDSSQKVFFEAQLRDIVKTKTGLSIDEYRMSDIWRMLDKLQATYKAFNQLHPDQISEWLRTLKAQPVESSEWRALIEVITVGETYFFRDAAQMRALQEHVLPKIIESHRTRNFKHLRFWSAGCATGEEAYTLAILLRELLPDFSEWTFFVLGTDINQTSLESARKGVFKARSFRDETRAGVQARWFRVNGKDFELDPEIRRMVKFSPLNLVSDSYPSYETDTVNLDLILCRNVTIYFNESTTREIIGRFYQALAPDGWLVVGHSEPLVSTYREFTPCNLDNAVVYHKQERYVTQEMQMVGDGFGNNNRSPATPPIRPVSKTAPLPPMPSQHRPFKTGTAPLVQPDHPAFRTGTAPLVSPNHLTAKTATASLVLSSQAAQKAPSQAAATSKRKKTATLQAAQDAADQEDWAALEHWLKVAERDDSFNPQLYYLRALMFMHLGELSLASDDLRRAIYCDPLFALAYYVLGEVYEKRGIPHEAKRSWELARKALTQIKPERMADSANGLTAEILQGFIAYQLDKLAEG